MEEAKSQRSQLAELAWQGDTVVINMDGRPYLDLVPHVGTFPARKPGRLKGKVRISADFADTPQAMIDGFEGSL
ncbi:antitoxin [Pseudomonas sp. Root562]|nr:antitoxin [Pseudomonas sp. Root562]